MVDTVRSYADIIALLADNTTEDISEQDQRDAFVTLARQEVITKTANYTALITDRTILADCTGGSFIITLPVASTATGYLLRVKRLDNSGNTVTIDGDSAETIDGSATLVMSSQFDASVLLCDGSNWHIM